MRKLYEIRSDLVDVLEGYRETPDGEALPDIHSIEMEAVDKIKACLFKCNEFRGKIIAAQPKLNRVLAYIKELDTAIKRIETDVMLTMEMAGITEINDEDLKLKIPKPSVKLFVEDEKLIPEQYFITIPATTRLDKKALLADVKISEEPIAGVKLIPNKVSLRYDKPKGEK